VPHGAARSGHRASQVDDRAQLWVDMRIRESEQRKGYLGVHEDDASGVEWFASEKLEERAR